MSRKLSGYRAVPSVLDRCIRQDTPRTGRPALQYAHRISHSGFSLIEIVIALAVMAIGLIAIVGLIPQGVQSARDAADNTLAATIVQDDLNNLRSTALTTWPPLAALQNICYDAAGTNVVSCGTASSYFRETLNPVTTSPYLVTIVAVVSWPAQSAAPLNNITNVTTIANYQR
jgi:uncharacterized protein (TIGR02598 family)